MTSLMSWRTSGSLGAGAKSVRGRGSATRWALALYRHGAAQVFMTRRRRLQRRKLNWEASGFLAVLLYRVAKTVQDQDAGLLQDGARWSETPLEGHLLLSGAWGLTLSVHECRGQFVWP